MEADNNRFISSSKSLTDAEIETSLRPTAISEYVGQDKIKEKLDIYIKAAKKRKEEKISYFSFFTEKWANNLGEKVTGKESMGNLLID